MDLVLQARSLREAALARASAIELVQGTAFRLRDARKDEAISSYCEARSIDYGWVPARRRFADLKLLAMCMDSTLITIECIDEVATSQGRRPRSRRSPR